MPVERIVCPRCRFEATYVGAGRRGRIQENIANKLATCLFRIEDGGDPMVCPHFNEAMSRPGRPA